MSQDPLLLPAPRELDWSSGTLTLSSLPQVTLEGARDAALEDTRTRVVESLRAHTGPLQRTAQPASSVQLRIDPDLRLPDEGFELAIDAAGVRLVAGEPRGLGWAAGTLDQILLQRGAALPHVRIRDWPDFAVRGYMLDVSRDRVPTMETLEHLVDLLATLRINELQLYTEHTFAYQGHETVWREASPMTPGEVRALDAACARRGIELVPNQNSFGHMERWLRHPQYHGLGERPEGGGCLAPGPASLAFVDGLYSQLLPCFHSRSINIGCDETFDLGQGRSLQACQAHGRGRVYLEFLLELIGVLHARGCHVQFWGDIIAQHPDLIGELPRQGITALAWGYEAPTNPDELPEAVRTRFGQVADLDMLRGFAHMASPFAASGIPFHVCPGTSSWNSLIGRWTNARANLRDAALAGRAHGATGYLITDWGDNGHLQPPSTSLLPLAYGAAVSWCADAAERLDLQPALDRLVLRDASGGCARALARLGQLGAETGLSALNASPLFLGLIRPLGTNLLCWGQTDLGRLEAARDALDAESAGLSGCRPAGFGGQLVVRELVQATALARHGAGRIARGELGQGPTKAALRAELEPLIDEQATTWRARSREGGLADSLARLERARSEYD